MGHKVSRFATADEVRRILERGKIPDTTNPLLRYAVFLAPAGYVSFWELRRWQLLRALEQERARVQELNVGVPYYGKAWGMTTDYFIETGLRDGDLLFFAYRENLLHFPHFLFKRFRDRLKGTNVDHFDDVGMVIWRHGVCHVASLSSPAAASGVVRGAAEGRKTGPSSVPYSTKMAERPPLTVSLRRLECPASVRRRLPQLVEELAVDWRDVRGSLWRQLRVDCRRMRQINRAVMPLLDDNHDEQLRFWKKWLSAVKKFFNRTDRTSKHFESVGEELQRQWKICAHKCMLARLNSLLEDVVHYQTVSVPSDRRSLASSSSAFSSFSAASSLSPAEEKTLEILELMRGHHSALVELVRTARLSDSCSAQKPSFFWLSSMVVGPLMCWISPKVLDDLTALEKATPFLHLQASSCSSYAFQTPKQSLFADEKEEEQLHRGRGGKESCWTRRCDALERGSSSRGRPPRSAASSAFIAEVYIRAGLLPLPTTTPSMATSPSAWWSLPDLFSLQLLSTAMMSSSPLHSADGLTDTPTCPEDLMQHGTAAQLLPRLSKLYHIRDDRSEETRHTRTSILRPRLPMISSS